MEPCSVFLASFANPGVFNEDTTVGLNGARSPPKYVCMNIKMSKIAKKLVNYHGGLNDKI